MANGGPCTTSHCDLDASLLLPDLKGPGAGAPVLVGGHQMSPWAEVAVDHGVGWQEALRLLRRLEALHLPFSAPGWSMGILGSVIQVAAVVRSRNIVGIRSVKPL